MIPSHQVAQWLVGGIDWFLGRLGLAQSATLESVIYFAIVLAIALAVGSILRWFILTTLRHWARIKNDSWSRELLHEHTLSKCCRIIPPLVLLGFLPFAFDNNAAWHAAVTKAVLCWLLLSVGFGVAAVLKFIWTRYDMRDNSRHLPMRGVYDLALGIVWVVICILLISVLANKSPAMLLTGLGAFAAALMLVFKDSILGFVASIQLSNNDMVRVGDWITVPGTLADGIVTDVNISTVKVQNFDNTMVMLPPYTLVSASFQNWRWMITSGIRRINHTIYIDASSVTSATNDPTTTNLTQFRAAVLAMLNAHPELNHAPHPNDNTLTMVRLLPTEPAGLPMQIYCFSATTKWEAYEDLQSRLVAQIIAMAPAYSIRVYNYPSTVGSRRGDGVVAATAPGVTAEKAAQGEPAAAQGTVEA